MSTRRASGDDTYYVIYSPKVSIALFIRSSMYTSILLIFHYRDIHYQYCELISLLCG